MALAPCLYVILPHPSEARILALPCASGWTLPQLQPDNTPDRIFACFEFGMKTRFAAGCAASALYCPYVDPANDEHGHRFVFVLENRDPAFPPPDGARWIGSDQVDQFAPEVLRPVLDTYFRERTTGVYPPERTPWAFLGWQD